MNHPDQLGPLGGKQGASAVSVAEPSSSRQERPPPAAPAAASDPTMPSDEAFKGTHAYASMSAKHGKYVKEVLLQTVAAFCKDALATKGGAGAFSDAPTELKNLGMALAAKHQNCTSSKSRKKNCSKELLALVILQFNHILSFCDVNLLGDSGLAIRELVREAAALTPAQSKRPLTQQQSEQWAKRFQELKDYKEENGDCNVPQGAGLGNWVSEQRRTYRAWANKESSPMTDERIQKLESIGFQWNPQQSQQSEQWAKRFQELKDYKEENGDCNVPPGAGLGNWVSEQRRTYQDRRNGKQSPMTEERIQKLLSIGFVWERPHGPHVVPSGTSRTSSRQGGGVRDGEDPRMDRAVVACCLDPTLPRLRALQACFQYPDGADLTTTDDDLVPLEERFAELNSRMANSISSQRRSSPRKRSRTTNYDEDASDVMSEAVISSGTTKSSKSSKKTNPKASAPEGDAPDGADLTTTDDDLGQLEAPKSSKSSKKAWSEEEDLILQNGVATEGGPRNWKRIAKKYFNNLRTANQCRLRWFNVNTYILNTS